MDQTSFLHDTIFDALGAAAEGAGGKKRVASKLWPTLDSTSAAMRLRAGLNVDHAQKLGPDEFVAIAKLGKEAGDHSVMEFLARELGYEVKPLATSEAKKRANAARLKALAEEQLRLLDELARLEDDE